MVGVQIVVGLDRNLFFQIILLFFEKFINIPLNGRGNLVFKVLDGVQTVVCQMIQSTVVVSTRSSPECSISASVS